MNYCSREKYSSSHGSVSCCAGCTRAFASQAQKNLTISREFCRSLSTARECFALRILKFDEVADTIPCRPARELIGLGCDILGFRISVLKGRQQKQGEVTSQKDTLVFANLAFALASVLLVKLVNRTLGL